MATLVLQNNSATTPLQINDLGIYLEPGENLDLLLNFRDEDLIESTDLSDAMSGDGDVTLNGSIEMTYQDVIDYLTKLTHYDIIDYAYITSEDSTTDITAAELEALTDGSDITSHTHDTRYYTQTQLQTSGQSAVHWGNITNAPAFASVHWKAPVANKAALPLTGNEINDARVVQDDGDGGPAQYICVATTGTVDDQWIKIADVDWGAASAISVVPSGNLISTNVQDALEELQGDIDTINGIFPTIDMDYVYNNGSTVTVDTTDVIWNLSDGRDFSVRGDSGSTEIFTVAATGAGDTVTLNGSLDVNGGSFDILGTSNSSIHTTSANLSLYTTTSGSITLNSAGSLTFKDQYLTSPIPISEPGTADLDPGFTATSIIGAINELLTTGGAVDTLDDAYDGPSGSGSGRTIIVDSGSVKLDATSSTYAPLELTPQTAAPSTGLSSGQMTYIGDTLYIYDGIRGKWLSSTELHFAYGDKTASGKILSIGDNQGNMVGYKMPHNATITMIEAYANKGNLSKTLQIWKNGVPTSLLTFSLSSGAYSNTNVNIDLNAGDILQVFVTAAGTSVQELVVQLFAKWRV